VVDLETGGGGGVAGEEGLGGCNIETACNKNN
jgi:hypothetical protein